MFPVPSTAPHLFLASADAAPFETSPHSQTDVVVSSRPLLFRLLSIVFKYLLPHLPPFLPNPGPTNYVCSPPHSETADQLRTGQRETSIQLIKRRKVQRVTLKYK
eukprot:GHVT01062224.1.p1 GENE.GHVT01062224.1~~GHVT01062224.1.p1  ORF type:complete len:105 (-),score=7.20 GHVT01062224.1:274-588(-)